MPKKLKLRPTAWGLAVAAWDVWRRLPPKQRAMFATEFHSRIAFPMANLVVFLIGVPFGVV